MVNDDGIYRDMDPTIRKSVNSGYIVIPDGVDRIQFIEQCLRTELFSILVENGGGMLHNCYITKSALRDISFPLEGQVMGSGVVFFTEPYGGKAVIMGVVSKMDETELNRDEAVIFKKSKDGNISILSVDGNGQINIDIIGINSNGALNINVRNDNFDAKINLSVKGDFNLISEGKTKVTASGGDIEITTDKSITLTSSNEVNIKSRKFIVHSGNEAMVRGNELKKNIEKTNEVVKGIQESLLTWVPVPSDGGAALKIKAGQKLSGKTVGDFAKINSEKSFLE